jgi:hypothetical protein
MILRPMRQPQDVDVEKAEPLLTPLCYQKRGLAPHLFSNRSTPKKLFSYLSTSHMLQYHIDVMAFYYLSFSA